MAREFSGSTSDYLTIGNVSALDITGEDITIHAWVNPDTISGEPSIVTKWNQGTVQHWAFHLNAGSGGSLLSGLAVTGGGSSFAVGATPVPIGRWSSVAARRKGLTGTPHQVYLNGKLDGQVASSFLLTTQSIPAHIGRLDNAVGPFDGRIAEVAVWAAGLDTWEIMLLAQGTNPLRIRPQSLRGYWPLSDYGASGQSKDFSGYGSTATQNGSVPPRPGYDLPYFDEYRLGDMVTADIAPPIAPTIDSATVYLELSVVGGECYSTFAGELLGEGDAILEWSAEDFLQWSADDNLEWSEGEVEVIGAHC